ncbi:MAG: helix-turn-helix domain-containing protein [Nitriliruptorales bacterium]
MSPQQTAFGMLLQDRREAAGYSRARVGALIGIKPGTIEGWELGRVARPPIHDVLRLAEFLKIPSDAVLQAVVEDAGEVPVPGEHPPEQEARGPRRRRPRGAVPVLEAAFRLFAWENDGEAADAIGTSRERVRAWRRGDEQMALADFFTLTSMIGAAAAEAMKGETDRPVDLSAAAEELGVRRSS